MAKITPIRITEQFEYFVAKLKDSFWGDSNALLVISDIGGRSYASACGSVMLFV